MVEKFYLQCDVHKLNQAKACNWWHMSEWAKSNLFSSSRRTSGKREENFLFISFAFFTLRNFVGQMTVAPVHFCCNWRFKWELNCINGPLQFQLSRYTGRDTGPPFWQKMKHINITRHRQDTVELVMCSRAMKRWHWEGGQSNFCDVTDTSEKRGSKKGRRMTGMKFDRNHTHTNTHKAREREEGGRQIATCITFSPPDQLGVCN